MTNFKLPINPHVWIDLDKISLHPLGEKIEARMNNIANKGFEEGSLATLRAVIEWGDEKCPHGMIAHMVIRKKRECSSCWASLKQENTNGLS